MYLRAPLAKGFSPYNASNKLEFYLMHCLLAPYADPVVLTNTRKLRLSKLCENIFPNTRKRKASQYFNWLRQGPKSHFLTRLSSYQTDGFCVALMTLLPYSTPLAPPSTCTRPDIRPFKHFPTDYKKIATTATYLLVPISFSYETALLVGLASSQKAQGWQRFKQSLIPSSPSIVLLDPIWLPPGKTTAQSE